MQRETEGEREGGRQTDRQRERKDADGKRKEKNRQLRRSPKVYKERLADRQANSQLDRDTA